VTDGIAMGPCRHARLASVARGDRRFVELTMRGHAYDALVGHGGLRQVPARHDDGDGAPERAGRLHLWRFDPAGLLPGRPVTVQDMFEAVGKHSSARCRTRTSTNSSRSPARPRGRAGAQFTANTMATVSEAIGLALPFQAGAPAPYEIRDRFCATAGEMVMELSAKTSGRATSSR
jgi:dihydroxy-acid dehydratase